MLLQMHPLKVWAPSSLRLVPLCKALVTKALATSRLLATSSHMKFNTDRPSGKNWLQHLGIRGKLRHHRDLSSKLPHSRSGGRGKIRPGEMGPMLGHGTNNITRHHKSLGPSMQVRRKAQAEEKGGARAEANESRFAESKEIQSTALLTHCLGASDRRLSS